MAELDASAEFVLCEGVMGLFDGTGADGETGSTAELARMTGWPVVLVVDARGQGASVAAVLRGFVGHRPDISIAGVIFNRVASERHRALLTLRSGAASARSRYPRRAAGRPGAEFTVAASRARAGSGAWSGRGGN